MGSHTRFLCDPHLPEEHVAAFETFSKLCSDKGLLTRPAGLADNEVEDGLNDETTRLRFLRARRFDPSATLKQFQEAVTTHDTNRISTLYNEIEVGEFETTRFLYPHWSGRRTKDGLPILLFDIAHLNQSTLTQYAKQRSRIQSLQTGITATQGASIVHDYLTRFVFPLCTAMQDRPDPTIPISGAVYLVDVTSFTIRQGWDIKGYVKDLGSLLMTGYPEIVNQAFILNAPPYFAWMWSIMRKWIDAGTAEKVVILSHTEMLPTLTKDIDMESIPSQFGGGFEWEHGQALDIDVGIREGLEWECEGENELPAGPMKWILDEDGRRTAVAVGSVDGVARTAKIARLRVDETKVECSGESGSAEKSKDLEQAV